MAAEQPPAGAGQPAVYRHAATGEQSVYHPFRAAFTALCKQAARWTWEPRRADAKAPEAWMEMADGSGGLFYYCFVTKARPQSDAAPPAHTLAVFTLWLHLPRRAHPTPPLTHTRCLYTMAALTQAREFEMPSLSQQVTLGLPLGLTANAQAEA